MSRTRFVNAAGERLAEAAVIALVLLPLACLAGYAWAESPNGQADLGLVLPAEVTRPTRPVLGGHDWDAGRGYVGPLRAGR